MKVITTVIGSELALLYMAIHSIYRRV